MTVQENPGGPQLLMLLMVLATVILVVMVTIRASGRRPVGRLVAILGGLVLLYAIAVVGVSAASGTTNLKPGDGKCFDEWCASMLGAQAGASPRTVAVQVRLENHGRRAQKSVLARAFVDAGGERIWPQNPDDLQVLVPAKGSLDVRFRFSLPTQLASPRFVVTEAASGELTPGLIVIGDESSPFHTLAGWPLSEFGVRPAG
jgi:hypothetical protein